ncbi:high affinity copper uptake protein 1-like isoform X2 [Babylonia areolata]
MYFHTGIVEYILFEQLHTHTAEGFAWACIVVFVVAFLYELMKYGREELFRQHHVRLMHTALSGNEEERSLLMRPKARMCSTGHLLQTALHGLQLVISYCLMLVFMTYNVYLCLSLVAGATLGYFLVGWKRSMVVDQTQHCE